MDMAYLGDESENQLNSKVVRNDPLSLWDDIFHYAANLNGNWHVSQDIFNRYLLPTAEKNPIMFAKWVNDMVKVSGLKIKCHSSFFKSLRHIKRFNFLKKSNRAELKKVLVCLFNAGLCEPKIAKIALEHAKNS
ncbi:MAG: hypothetical protein PHC34_05115 [Candidatus Gastranaerophilales bacterium]|nr:hypothetical protein [Candidatus Gastranaerophilales bacterium]